MPYALGKARSCVVVFLCAMVVSSAWGFDPAGGDWGKDDARHIRVLTYNVKDGIGIGVDTTPATPTTYGSQYDYLGRICAAMDPDVICLQEVDPSADLGDTEDVVQGWADTYFGAGVLGVYVSTMTDGYNRNVILSRYPFADLNGDVEATAAGVMVFTGPGGLPPGFTGGGIRGWAQAEIDLPDEVYKGDLFVGNSHMKSGSSSSDKADRLAAAQDIAWWINEALNDAPPPPYSEPPVPLDEYTPVVLCGDFNEDEDYNSRYGPVAWLAGWTEDPGDGTDREDSEMHIDTAVEPFSLARRTFRGESWKLDYVLVQDSIATVAVEFIFESDDAESHGVLPPELQGILQPSVASSFASDHYPVIVDLELAVIVPGDFNDDGSVDVVDYSLFSACLFGPGGGAAGDCAAKDLDGDGDVDLGDFALFQQFFGL